MTSLQVEEEQWLEWQCQPRTDPPAPTLVPQQGAQQGAQQGVRPQASNNHQAAISSTEVSTARAQVLLNVVPVTVTVEDGYTLSMYAFLDNGCTNTLVDRELADRLKLILKVFQNKLVSKRSEAVKNQWSGSDIDVSTLARSDLSRSWPTSGFNNCREQCACCALENEVGVPPDNNGPYVYRCPLGWSLAEPLTNRDKGKAVVNFLSVGLQTEDQIERYWKIEDYGATKAGDKPFQSRTGEH